MAQENEFHLVYSEDKERLRVNLEDLKRYQSQQTEKRSKKTLKRTYARAEAKRKGFKLGRWRGTYAKIKNRMGYYHLNTQTVSETRPGPQSKDA